MSYCRWSSDNWTSDVYVYEAEDGFTVHVASKRIVGDIPPILNLDKEEWLESYQKQMEFIHTAEHKTIGGAFDGKTFCYDTLGLLVEGLRMLKRAGYRIPEYLIPDIEKEIAEG
jgi:hypothetical protein